MGTTNTANTTYGSHMRARSGASTGICSECWADHRPLGHHDRTLAPAPAPPSAPGQATVEFSICARPGLKMKFTFNMKQSPMTSRWGHSRFFRALDLTPIRARKPARRSCAGHSAIEATHGHFADQNHADFVGAIGGGEYEGGQYEGDFDDEMR